MQDDKFRTMEMFIEYASELMRQIEKQKRIIEVSKPYLTNDQNRCIRYFEMGNIVYDSECNSLEDFMKLFESKQA